MEGGIKFCALRLQKPERKVIEKNRREQMKCLYSRLYSLVPPNFISKGDHRGSNQMDRTIAYIQTLKNNLEMSKNKKEKLLRSHQHTKVNNVPLDIQIHQISHDLDAVLVTGLNSYSSFCDVVRSLDHCSAEITHASFSSNGHSTFHIRQKQIEADDICKRVKNLAGGYSSMKELGDASFCNEVDPDLSVWDFDFQSRVCEWELGMIFKRNGESFN